MTRMTIMIAALCVVVVGGGYAVWNLTKAPEPVFSLLTEEQMAQFTGEEAEKVRSLKVDASDGPIVKVSAPQGYSLASPVDFDIIVEPRDGVAVDMSSIRIDYRLGPAWVNMTRRIMKYASVKGSRLYARGADLPKGKHALRISILDAQNRKTQATVSFTVTK